MKRPRLLLLLLLFLLVQQTLAQDNRLVTLAGKGDVAGVKALLASGANPNAIDNSDTRGWTALMAAAKAGNLEVTGLLIQAHANVNATNQFGATALDVARLSGHGQLVSMIVAAGGKGRPEPITGTGNGGQTGIVNLKLAIQEPRIKARLPDLELRQDSSGIQQQYELFGNGLVRSAQTAFGSSGTLSGERVTVRLWASGHIVAEASWSTDFPPTVSLRGGADFRAAEVLGGDLLIKLLSLREFTADDLAALANSAVLEVRIGARANITSRALLAELHDPALLDESRETRRSAVEKLMDQGVLAKVASVDKDWFVRIAAVKKLTDQPVLAKIAVADEESLVRSAAVEHLTDQALLARVAEQDRSTAVREAAEKRQAELLRGK